MSDRDELCKICGGSGRVNLKGINTATRSPDYFVRCPACSDWRSRLTQLRDEMRTHARNAFEVPGPDVVTAPQVVRWTDTLDAILSGQEPS
jgi:hypothetical protein